MSVAALLPCGHMSRHKADGCGLFPTTFGDVSDFGTKGSCESCGTPDEILHRVQREYFSTEPGGESTLMPDVEEWCFACCTHYPHRMLD